MGGVLYIAYGDVLGNVYGSQIRLLWQALAAHDVKMRAGAFLSFRVLANTGLRRRLAERRRSSPIPFGVSYLGVGFPPRWPHLLERQLGRWLTRHSPQAVIAHGPVAAGLAARVIRTRPESRRPTLIFEVRGDTLAELETGDLLPDSDRKPGQIETMKKLEEDACRQADSLFCVSTPLENLMRARHGYGGPIEIVPCSVREPDGYCLPDETLRRKMRAELNLPETAWVWGYAGSAARWQALPQTIALLRRLHGNDGSQRGLFVTDEPGKVADLCAAARLPSEAYRIRTGTQAETIRWLVAADAAILLRENNPINRVACPMKFGDYLLAGLPVLASAGIGDISDWVEHCDVGSTTCSLDPKGLEPVALELVGDRSPERRTAWRTRTQRLYQEKLRLDTFIPTYLEALALPRIPSAHP